MNSLILTLEEKIARTQHMIRNLTQDIKENRDREVHDDLVDYRCNARRELSFLMEQI